MIAVWIVVGWLVAILIIAAFVHGASKARADRAICEEIDAVTGRKG